MNHVDALTAEPSDRLSDELTAHIGRLIKRLESLNGSDVAGLSSPTMRQFLMGNLHLYLFVQQHAELQEGLPLQVYQAYLEQSGSALAGKARLVEDFVDATEAIMDAAFVSDEWRVLCERRSAIQVLRELYPRTAYGPFLSHLETSALDERMENARRHEGCLNPDEIPAGVPSSHWWWLPERLPTDTLGTSNRIR